MAKKGIREYDAKRLINKALPGYSNDRFHTDGRLVLVTPETDLDKLPQDNPWLNDTKLVVKPDQLFGKRGKNNLLLVNATFPKVRSWIEERMNEEVTIVQTTGETTGILTHFLIEPFVPHEEEYYLAFTSRADADIIHFSLHGGVDIEEVWDSVVTIEVPILTDPATVDVLSQLPEMKEKAMVAAFIKALYQVYCDY